MKYLKVNDIYNAGGGATNYSSIIAIDTLTRDDIFTAGNSVILITEKAKSILDDYARENKTLDAEIYDQKVEYSLKHSIEQKTNRDQLIKKKLIRLSLKMEDEITSKNEFFIHKGYLMISERLFNILNKKCRLKHWLIEETYSKSVEEKVAEIQKPIFAQSHDKKREIKMGVFAAIISIAVFTFIFRIMGIF